METLVVEEQAPQALRQTVMRYGFAVLVVALAGGLTLLLPPVAEGTPFLFFFAAVMTSAWYGGLGPALLTMVLAAVWSSYFLLPPLHSLRVGAPADILRLSLFFLVAFFISALQARQQWAAAAERVHRKYWQTTLASIGDAVIVTDARGHITVMNAVAQQMTGWSFDEAQGRALQDVFVIVNEDTRQPVEDPVNKVLRTGTVAGLANHTILCTKDGRELAIDDSASPIRDGSGRLQGIVMVFRDITERRQAEAALQDSHALLSAIIEGAQDAIFVKDREGRYMTINTTGARWLGKTVQDVIGHRDAELFAPESTPAILAYDQQVLQTGEPQAYEHTGIAEGNTRTYHSVKFPYRDRHGAIVGVIGIARDISERKRMEETLRLSEARYRTVSDLVSDYAYAVRIEPGGRTALEWVTGAFGRITGFTPQELEVKEGLAWLVHPADLPSVQQRLQALFAGQAGTSEYRIITKSGEVRWLRDYSTPEWDAAQSRVVRVIGAGQDITERKQAEEANLQLAAIVESSDDAIVSKSLDGIVKSWNAAAERIYGYRAEEMIGQPILRLIPEDRHDEETMILERLRRGEHIDHFETIRRTKDGRLLDVSVTISPLRNAQGTIIGASKIARDITARRAAAAEFERQAGELQRVNDELQQFAYIVSHDLNEPLRAISNFLQLFLLRSQAKLDSEDNEYLAFVIDGAQRMQQMLADLLAYTRVGQTPEFGMVDCEAVLDRVLAELQTRVAESGAIITHDPLPIVPGDATRLGQVFQNLLGNALKFCSKEVPRIHVAAVPHDGHWRFAVQDNGIGIDPSQTGRLFQVFRRLHTRSEYPGTGIGLVICKKIVEQHGGRIWVESRLGEGATFYFTIRDPGHQQSKEA